MILLMPRSPSRNVGIKGGRAPGDWPSGWGRSDAGAAVWDLLVSSGRSLGLIKVGTDALKEGLPYPLIHGI